MRPGSSLLPPICRSEGLLPRHYRRTLSHLRSEVCKGLGYYQHRVRFITSPLCPLCGADEQSTFHLFSCTSVSTPLVLSSLWSAPCEVVTFLSPHPSFVYLPPLPRPRCRGGEEGGAPVIFFCRYSYTCRHGDIIYLSLLPSLPPRYVCCKGRQRMRWIKDAGDQNEDSLQSFSRKRASYVSRIFILLPILK